LCAFFWVKFEIKKGGFTVKYSGFGELARKTSTKLHLQITRTPGRKYSYHSSNYQISLDTKIC